MPGQPLVKKDLRRVSQFPSRSKEGLVDVGPDWKDIAVGLATILCGFCTAGVEIARRAINDHGKKVIQVEKKLANCITRDELRNELDGIKDEQAGMHTANQAGQREILKKIDTGNGIREEIKDMVTEVRIDMARVKERLKIKDE